MMMYINRAREFLRVFVELLFFFVMAVVLLHLVLGESGGPFVNSVADNVTKFAAAVPSSSLIGIAIVVGLAYLIMQRMDTGTRTRK